MAELRHVCGGWVYYTTLTKCNFVYKVIGINAMVGYTSYMTISIQLHHWWLMIVPSACFALVLVQNPVFTSRLCRQRFYFSLSSVVLQGPVTWLKISYLNLDRGESFNRIIIQSHCSLLNLLIIKLSKIKSLPSLTHNCPMFSFQIETPLSEDQLASGTDHLQTFIDPAITQTDTMANLKNRPRLVKFMETHCLQRHYHFSVKKCGVAGCEFCFDITMPLEDFEQLHFLPDPVPGEEGHYQPFLVS